jgi:hypothetical protein
MNKGRKSWGDKLRDDAGLPRVITPDGKMSKRWAFSIEGWAVRSLITKPIAWNAAGGL